ncbi:hypothetical protein GUJ93_ZPchr0006g40978 [Zizania palustris]|uniref:VQ domain-containing protein n=1 Tax=Zizania palustris TaxID=103762 RepID=A0A8J5TBW4_ZIZPA|nr:hypothetical protein GUJ93_ZPchr0006g40978 [Zizania palustris]
MELHGAASRQQGGDGGGVKVKFIETQFIRSDAASFKSVVQRLTGKSAPSPPQPTAPRPDRTRARTAAVAVHGGHYAVPGGDAAAGVGYLPAAPVVKQEAWGGAVTAPASLEYPPYELCSFDDLLYAASTAGGERRANGAGYGFPY